MTRKNQANKEKDRREFLSGAGKLAGLAALLGVSSLATARDAAAQTPAVAPRPIAPPQVKLAPRKLTAEGELKVARTDLLREFISTGKLDASIAKFPNAKLTPEQLAGLKAITATDLKAMQSLRAKLQALNLGQFGSNAFCMVWRNAFCQMWHES